MSLFNIDDFKNYKDLDEIRQSVINPNTKIEKELGEDYSKYVGFSGFQLAYDEVEKEMPEARQYRNLLTKIASHESGFNHKIQNKLGAPAYGYFQFMEDGLKYNNITAYANTDIESFRKDPKLQIKAAINLVKAFKRRFTLDDINKAQEQGITLNGLIGGAWLAGPGGVKKYLNGLGDPSDKHWSKNGQVGSSVSLAIKRYNL